MTYTIKDHIEGTATFVQFRDSALWYQTEKTGLVFPVSIDEVGTTTFRAEEKGILLMRWIRKYMNTLETEKSEEA